MFFFLFLLLFYFFCITPLSFLLFSVSASFFPFLTSHLFFLFFFSVSSSFSLLHLFLLLLFCFRLFSFFLLPFYLFLSLLFTSSFFTSFFFCFTSISFPSFLCFCSIFVFALHLFLFFPFSVSTFFSFFLHFTPSPFPFIFSFINLSSFFAFSCALSGTAIYPFPRDYKKRGEKKSNKQNYYAEQKCLPTLNTILLQQCVNKARQCKKRANEMCGGGTKDVRKNRGGKTNTAENKQSSTKYT